MVTNNAANNVTAATGKVLQGAGVGTASAFSTATYPSVATGTGTILRADGTNWVATTATYPNTAGTSGNVLTSDGTNWNSTAPASSGGTLGTPQTTTSGTTALFTGMASTSKLIVINFDRVSASGTDAFTIQLGSGGSLQTSGYNGFTTNILTLNNVWSSSAFLTTSPSIAASQIGGQIVLSLLNASTNVWSIASQLFTTTVSQFFWGAGTVTLAGTIDRFQVAMTGVNTFDNGQINFLAYS